MSYADIVKTRTPKTKKTPIVGTPQTVKAHEAQVLNHAGGYVFKVDSWKQLERFIILGSSKPTYYVDAKTLTLQNAGVVTECAKLDPVCTADIIAEISTSGRAFKNDPALFALAVMAEKAGPEARAAAFKVLPKVARIPTHLFDFNANLNALGGKWNKSRAHAISNWYNNQNADSLAYSMVKYQQRNKWSHGDMIRLSHVHPATDAHNALFHWASNGDVSTWEPRDKVSSSAKVPHIIEVYEEMKAATNINTVTSLITSHGLAWEFVPSEWLGKPEVWEALLPHMQPTALIRNLGRMTANGLLKPLSQASKLVVEKLNDIERMKKARVHPFSALLAQKIYMQGHGDKGKLTWDPVVQIIGALEDAFYNGFTYAQPTGQRYLWAQDLSGSMGSPAGEVPISCAEAGAAMALTIAKTEENYHVMGFAHDLKKLPISNKTSLPEATQMARDSNWGATDCALPMLWAMDNKIEVDTFIVCTDNETYAGTRGHPFQALEMYRQTMGIDARMIVCAMAPTSLTIAKPVANPNDAGMLDVVGLDANLPQLIGNFSVGLL